METISISKAMVPSKVPGLLLGNHLLPQVLNQSLSVFVVCYDTCIASSQLFIDTGPKLSLDSPGVIALEGEEH